MKMKYKILLFVILAVFALGLIGSLFVLFSKNDDRTVEILSDGELVREIDLGTAKDEVFEISCDSGVNTIEIKNGEIFVKDADCPDRICIKTGALRSHMPIVCLPHRLVIRFKTGGDVDTLTR